MVGDLSALAARVLECARVVGIVVPLVQPKGRIRVCSRYTTSMFAAGKCGFRGTSELARALFGDGASRCCGLAGWRSSGRGMKRGCREKRLRHRGRCDRRGLLAGSGP